MSIRGLLTHGLLDSPSEMLTLGLDSGEVTAPDGPGFRTVAILGKSRSIATIAASRTVGNITQARKTAEWDQ